MTAAASRWASDSWSSITSWMMSPSVREANEFPREPAVRHPAHRVLITRAHRFQVGHVHDGTLRPGGGDHFPGEPGDGDLLRAAHVDRLAERAIRLGQPDHGCHHIVHVTEAAHLRAGAKNGEWFTAARLPDEPGDDHPVVPSLAWPDRVEKAHDDRPQATLAHVRVDQALVDGLG